MLGLSRDMLEYNVSGAIYKFRDREWSEAKTMNYLHEQYSSYLKFATQKAFEMLHVVEGEEDFEEIPLGMCQCCGLSPEQSEDIQYCLKCAGELEADAGS